MATITKLKEHLENCGKIRRKPFKVTHTGFYKTRDGRKAFVSYVEPSNFYPYRVFGVVCGEGYSSFWSKKGELWIDEEHPKDIVAEWED